MSLFRTPARPTPEGWGVVQRSTKTLPREVIWPEDRCVRCRVSGQMDFSTGRALCSHCSENTVVQVASPHGLHERRVLPELDA